MLFNGERWKKETESPVDVSMGSFDGEELCELVGIYIQPLLNELINKRNSSLYWDERLILLLKINKQQNDKLLKNVIGTFQSFCFKTEIIINLKEVDFLDVTFNLKNNTNLNTSSKY